MSSSGAPRPPDLDGAGLQVAVVAARWHAEVADALVEGAGRALARCRVTDKALVRVAGAFELPLVAQALARERYHAVVALGVVIRGGTPHFDYVCQAVTHGCARVALDTGVPVGFGVLTCEDIEQALARCGLPGSTEDKGSDAALAAVEAALLLGRLRSGASPGRAPG